MGKNDSASTDDQVQRTADSEKVQEQLAVPLTPDHKSKILEEIMYLETRIEVLGHEYQIMVESLEDKLASLAVEESVTEKNYTPWPKRAALKVARWMVDRPEAKPQKVEPISHISAEKKFIAEGAFQVRQQIEKVMAERDQKMGILDTVTRGQLEAKSNIVSIRDFVAKRSGGVLAVVAQSMNAEVVQQRAKAEVASKKPAEISGHKELSPEQVTELLAILKKRFESPKKRYKTVKGFQWKDIEMKLEVSPKKLWSLNEMERTGGEPDFIEYDEKTGEYIFMDCSAESPTGRRNCVYDKEVEEYLNKKYPDAKYNGNAMDMAASMGINLLTESEYRNLQQKGQFDKSTFSWLKTPFDRRTKGAALSGDRIQDEVHVRKRYVFIHNAYGAWRGSLRIY